MRHTLILIALILAALLAGCGLNRTTIPEATPTFTPVPPTFTPAPTATPTATPVPTIDPAGDPDAPPTLTFTGTGVEALDNYSAALALTFEGTGLNGGPAVLQTNATLNGRRDPASQRLDMQYHANGVNPSGLGLGSEADGQFRLLIAGDTAYVTQNVGTDTEACVALPSSMAEGLIGSLVSYDGLVGTDLPELTRVEPNEVINGVESRHYHLDNLTTGEFTNGTMDVWVARDGGYVTRIVINGTGTFTGLGEGALNATYELVATQQAVDYSPPGDCEPLSS